MARALTLRDRDVRKFSGGQAAKAKGLRLGGPQVGVRQWVKSVLLGGLCADPLFVPDL